MPRQTFVLEYKDFKIPIKVFKEFRKSTRVSIATKGAYIRIPMHFIGFLHNTELEKCKDWIKEKLKTSPEKFVRFVEEKYPSEKEIQIFDKPFKISVSKTLNKFRSLEIKFIDQHSININISDDFPICEEAKFIKKSLSKFISKNFKKDLVEEVNFYNSQFFKKEIKNIRLKYNKSNWGSCSSDKNLNFSTRITLAPKIHRHYVIVHELSHLIEMNHSERFWALVKKVCPEYKLSELWFKKNGQKLDF